MSAIDCANNVHVGEYYGISTYWTVQDQDRDGVTEMPYDKGKKLTINDIVIGGGSGEHPAMVVNIDYAISTMALLKDDKYFGIYGYIDKNSWDVPQLQSLYNKIVIDENEQSFDSQILLNVAALVIFELPLEHCIVDPRVLKYAQGQRIVKPWEYFQGFTAVFDSQKCGRTLAPNSGKTGDSHVIWGYSLEDWYRNNGGRK